MVVIPEERQMREVEVEAVPLRVSSYKLGKEYACTVDNIDPGAVIARARADTREEVERLALARAREAIGYRRRA
jgi:hypothetical protein